MSNPVKWTVPPDVRQDYTDTCWAAVMEAFCAVAPGRPKIKQNDVLEQFKKHCHKDGTMTRRGLHIIFADGRFGLTSTDVTTAVFRDTSHLEQKLQKGHVIVGYWEPKISGWHVGLVYGLNAKQVSYLNPDSANGGFLRSPLSYFCAKGTLAIAHRKW